MDIVKQDENREKLQHDTIRKLTNQNQAYKIELESLHDKSNSKSDNLSNGERAKLGIIPSAATIEARLEHSNDGRLLVEIEVSHDLVIFLVVLLSDGLFKNSESKIELSRRGDKVVRIPFENMVRIQSEISIKATVGYPGSEVMHVLENVISVPRFAQFVPVNQPVICKEGVEFSISERIQRMILWIEENFLLKNSIDNRIGDLGLSFKSKNEFLNLHMNNGRVIIETKVNFSSKIQV